ncbi:hypothetical protein [Amycolatopsis taiwanensis]|uniref:Uncharacterized protein n=1 Tax=Amycolatopsis taiwanensis TaxID=342230 RepID=A0A9W6VEF2_9PSEU|nr:hypothetical protein [Amycolatopsis taiwanensis]GLY63714.1 hypothetical protein Atai01_03330 [Amycolatopsis taiwanensis]
MSEKNTAPRCYVCKAPRNPAVQPLDSIAHAQCDQRVARFPHDHADYMPGFFESAGAAMIYNER